jgi:hypothetical protein
MAVVWWIARRAEASPPTLLAFRHTREGFPVLIGACTLAAPGACDSPTKASGAWGFLFRATPPPPGARATCLNAAPHSLQHLRYAEPLPTSTKYVCPS